MISEEGRPEYENLRHMYFRLNSDLVRLYCQRRMLWDSSVDPGIQGKSELTRVEETIERLTGRVAELKLELKALSEQAQRLGNGLKFEQMARKHGLSEVERDVLTVLLMQDVATASFCVACGCLSGSVLLKLFFRDDFEVLETRRLLYSDAPLRANGLVVVDEYADSVVQSTFRIPEQMIRRFLEHDAQEV